MVYETPKCAAPDCSNEPAPRRGKVGLIPKWCSDTCRRKRFKKRDNARARAWAIANKSKVNESYRNKRRKQKLDLVTLAGGKCIDCGFSDTSRLEVFDFDHRDPATRNVKIHHSTAAIPLKLALEEIKKCDLVCANCHRTRTSQRRQWKRHS